MLKDLGMEVKIVIPVTQAERSLSKGVATSQPIHILRYTWSDMYKHILIVKQHF